MAGGEGTGAAAVGAGSLWCERVVEESGHEQKLDPLVLCYIHKIRQIAAREREAISKRKEDSGEERGDKVTIRRLGSWVFSALSFLGGLSLSRFLFGVAPFPFYVMMPSEQKKRKEKKRKTVMSWVSAVNRS